MLFKLHRGPLTAFVPYSWMMVSFGVGVATSTRTAMPYLWQVLLVQSMSKCQASQLEATPSPPTNIVRKGFYWRPVLKNT